MARGEPRPWAIACDGRGSAPCSHLGAEAALHHVQNFLAASESLLSALLDSPTCPQRLLIKDLLADGVYRAAAYAQKHCADQHGGTPPDYEFTLLFCVIGKTRSFFLHVGDGAVVAEQNGTLKLLSAPQNGEFANQTTFVRYGKAAPMRAELIPARGLTGLGLFSDGTAERMVQSGTNRPAPAFTSIWEEMRGGTFQRVDLLDFLTRMDWEPKVQDDRCLALLARSEEDDSLIDTPETSVERKEHPHAHIRIRRQSIRTRTSPSLRIRRRKSRKCLQVRLTRV